MLRTLRALPRFIRSYRINKRMAEKVSVLAAQNTWLPIAAFDSLPYALAVVRAPGKNPCFAMQIRGCGELDGWYSLGGNKSKLSWQPTEFWNPPFHVDGLKELPK